MYLQAPRKDPNFKGPPSLPLQCNYDIAFFAITYGGWSPKNQCKKMPMLVLFLLLIVVDFDAVVVPVFDVIHIAPLVDFDIRIEMAHSYSSISRGIVG